MTDWISHPNAKALVRAANDSDPYGVAPVSDAKQTETESEIVAAIQTRFRTFGGGEVRNTDNPIAHALKDQPAQFAAGVDVAQVVRFVLTAYFALRDQRADDPSRASGSSDRE